MGAARGFWRLAVSPPPAFRVVLVGLALSTLIGGLHTVSTLAAYRGRGYGTALTERPSWDARRLEHTTAILQAAPDGAGIRSFGEIAEYKPAAIDLG